MDLFGRPTERGSASQRSLRNGHATHDQIATSQLITASFLTDYYTLTPEGLDYLREWLHLPAEIVPATHIKQQRSHAPPRGMLGEEERRKPFGRGRGEGRGGDRDGGYRRRDAGEGGKEGGAPGEFNPQL